MCLLHFPVAMTNVWQHYFVQWYGLVILRILTTVLVCFVIYRGISFRGCGKKVFCVCACDSSESLNTCDTMLCHYLKDCNTPLEQTAGYEPRTEGKEATRKPLRYRSKVSAEPWAVEEPSASAITPKQLIMTSVRPQAGHDNDQLCQATLYLMW